MPHQDNTIDFSRLLTVVARLAVVGLIADSTDISGKQYNCVVSHMKRYGAEEASGSLE
jgi:hypothetical protein